MGMNPQATVEAAFAAYQQGMRSGGDLAEMRQFFAPGYVHTVETTGAGRLSGTYHGFDEFARFLKDSATAPGFHLDPPEFEESEDTVRMFLTVRFDDGYSDDEILFVVRDGLIVSATHTIGDAPLADKLYPVS